MNISGCKIVAVAFLSIAAASLVGAEQPAAPSPVMQHYRAYRAALDHGDLPLAEVEAASALAASVEQVGDGGRTAVLAVNLAGVRLTRGEYASAVEPARLALSIAETQGVASGVDVLVVRLLLGRAELPGGGVAAMDRLAQAVKDAQGVAGIDGEAYPAAEELAVEAYEAESYARSREAWAASARFAEGSRVNVDYARAKAMLGQAAAAIMMHLREPLGTSTGSRLAATNEFAKIDAMLAEAIDIIHDQAVESEAGGELTLAQAVFGQALAWKSALNAKLGSEKRPLASPEQPRNQNVNIGDPREQPPVCEIHTVTTPMPVFPFERRVADGVGAVTLKLLLDDSGRVTRVQVAGSVGGQAFADSVVLAARQWHVEKVPTAVPGCRMPREYFLITTFAYT